MAYHVNCTQDDEFMVKSEDEDEVMEMVKQHASQKHDMHLSDGDARDMIERT
jgi:predicted small metal-binding protein